MTDDLASQIDAIFTDPGAETRKEISRKLHDIYNARRKYVRSWYKKQGMEVPDTYYFHIKNTRDTWDSIIQVTNFDRKEVFRGTTLEVISWLKAQK